MRSKFTLAMALISSMLFVQATNAAIDSGAPSASHHLEETVAEMHDYLHHHYDSSYGSHHFEDVVSKLHSNLHHLEHGEATEDEVREQFYEVKSAWKDYRFQVTTGGLLHSGDEMLS